MARNGIAHPGKTEMTRAEFQAKWQELTQVLLRLGTGIPDLLSTIDNLEQNTIDPAHEKELLEELDHWKTVDEDLRKEVSKLTSDMTVVKYSQKEMKEDIKRLQDGKAEGNTMTTLYDRTEKLSIEVTELDSNVKKMTITEENVKQLQEDVGYLTQNQTQLKADVSEAQKGVEELSKMSDELRHLASCTKMELEDAKMDASYVKTEQHHKAKDTLTKHKLLILSGHPGEGKTTMARQLACEMSSIDKCLELTCPKDWRLLDLDKSWFETLIIDDIFGAGALDESLAKKWERCIPSIKKAPEKGLLNIIITTRHYIFKEAETILRKLPIFKKECVMTLSSAELSDTEMTQMLKTRLDKGNRKYDPQMIRNCISMTRSNLELFLEDKNFVFGYPQCVKMFVDSDDLFNRGPKYFHSPKELFKNCIEEMYRNNKNRFLPLVLVWAKKGQKLTVSELDDSYGLQELKDIAESFEYKWKFSTPQKVRKSLEHFEGLFLEYDSRKGSYQFNHHVVEDMVGIVLSKDCPKAVLKYASRDFMLNYITVDAEIKNSSYHFFVQEYLYNSLAEKMFALFLTPSNHHYLYHHSDGFHGTGRCPNKVSERSNIDVSLITSNIFKDERFVEEFVKYLRGSEANELLSTPIICLEGHFLGYGICSEKIAIYLPEYFLQNGVPLVIEKMLRGKVSWGDGHEPVLDVALLIAAHKGSVGTVHLLLQSGAKITEELVYIAAVSNHTDVLDFIMKKGYKPCRHLQNFSIINGNNALIASAKRGLKKSVEILIKYGVNLKYKNEKGLSALDKAALFDHPEVCKLLLDYGAEVDTRSGKFKRTPLQTACDKGNIEVVKVLLKYNPKTDIKDHRGHYAIHCAAFQGHTKVVETLLQYNKELAKQTIASYGTKSKIKGMTVYHIAIWKDNLDMLKMLVNFGADHSMADWYGRSPLFYAAQRGKMRLVDALKMTSPNVTDKQGFTPLHSALMWGHLEVAKLLLPLTDVNIMDKKGRTPLHLACQHDFTAIAKEMVLEHHADIHMETGEGLIVLDIVMERNNRELFSFFSTIDPFMYENFARRNNH